MARPKGETAGATGPSAPVTDDPKWWTHRECQVYLGGISKQRWGRIRAEHTIPTQTDDRGVDRFSAEAVIELGERLGITETSDATTTALQTMRDVIEMQSGYIRDLQSHNVKVSEIMFTENSSLRTMREKEQQAFLQALDATQEALDHSAERKALVAQQTALSERQDLALGFFMTEVAPRIMAGFGKEKRILVELIQGLSDEKIELLRPLVSEEQFDAIRELRKDIKKENATDEQKSA